MSGALKSREDAIPEAKADTKKPRRPVVAIRSSSLKNSFHSINSDDDQPQQQTKSSALAASERAPLLKGL